MMRPRQLISLGNATWAAIANVGAKSIGLRCWQDGTHSIEEWTNDPLVRSEIHNGSDDFAENFRRWLHKVNVASGGVA